MLFVCPKCRRQLNKDASRAICDSGHSFDISKEGYINLLLGRGGLHGDNADMVLARREFLSAGFYEPLARRIAELVCEYKISGLPIVDAGCGEGYYTEFVKNSLCGASDKSFEKPEVFGYDISKDAVKRAAKRRGDIGFAVASSYDMPIPDGSVGVLFNVFSPLAHSEVKRVLTRGGIFIMAIAGEEHLFGLKEKIYDTPYKNTLDGKDIPGMRLVLDSELRFPLRLTRKNDIMNLFKMTPYAYRTSETGRNRVANLKTLETDAHFYILAYEKL